DSAGRYQNLRLGELSAEEGWHLLTGTMPSDGDALTEAQMSTRDAEYHLIAIFLSGSTLLASSSSVNFDDVTTWGPGLPENGVVIGGFEDSEPWTPIPSGGREGDLVETSADAAHSGQYGLRLTLGQFQGLGARGIFLPSGPYPIPVIGGPGFEVGQQFVLRSDRSFIPVEVSEVLQLFPTLDPRTQQFLLINLDHYSSFLSHLSPTQKTTPNEIWITPGPETDRSQFLATLNETLSPSLLLKERQGAVDSALRDPLAAGAWEGLSLLSVVVLIAAILLGLGLLGAVSLHQGRLDLSVVRTLGFSSRQVMASLVTERVLLVVPAMLAGSGVGILLGRWVLDYLDVTPTGRPIIPPLILARDEPLLALAYISLAAAALITIGFTLVLARRLRAAQVLRHVE
ncbi:MAG: FtsX-like permease family protein, partial [Dehalococcoidia bacterium]